jgi:DNA-binding PadR family transcriptional regulator
MRYTILINAVKCQEWDLTLSQGALFDLLNQAHTWAKHIDVNGELFFWVSRNMIINEIPLAYSKPDTVYRAFKTLSDKGLIVHAKRGQKDLVRLTEKGKEWNAKNSDLNPNVGNKSEIPPKTKQKNSEINPTFEEKLGNKSEKIAKNSEINPTNKLTINPLTINPITNGAFEEKINPLVHQEKKPSKRDLEIKEVFDTWISLTDQKIKFDSKRKSHIKARLDHGYTLDQIKTAMSYVANSQWHKENGQVRLELVVRSNEQLDQQLIKATKAQPNNALAVNQNWQNANRKPLVANATSLEDFFA